MPVMPGQPGGTGGNGAAFGDQILAQDIIGTHGLNRVDDDRQVFVIDLHSLDRLGAGQPGGR